MSRMVQCMGIALALAGIIGCEETLESACYEQLPDEAVLAAVDDVRLTKADLERNLKIMGDLLSLSGGSVGNRLTPSELACSRGQIVEGFVDRELMVREATSRRIELTPDEMLVFQRQFAAEYSVGMRLDFDAILLRLGKQATGFRNDLKREALASKMRDVLRREIAAHTSVTREAAVRERDNVVAELEKRVAVNADLRRLATNAWRSIKAGNAFADVGRKLAQLNSRITFEADCAIDDATLAAVADGALTPPLPRDNGLEILQARGKGTARRYDRIRFGLQMGLVVPTVEKAMELMRQQAVEETYLRRLDGLRHVGRVKVRKITWQ